MSNAAKIEPDLYKRSLKGGFWVGFLRIFTHVIGIVKSIIIVNAIQISDFGIIGPAFVLMGLLSILSETGYNAALIQKKEHVHDYLDTAWTIGLIRGILLFCLLYAATPFFVPLAIPEGQPDKHSLAIAVIRSLGVCFLIQGSTNIGLVHFTRNMNFRPLTLIKVGEVFIDFAVSLTWLYLYRNIWAYIAGWLASGLFGCIMGYFICEYKPRFRLDISKARELWKFGKWVYFMSILDYILTWADQSTASRMLGLDASARYWNANRYGTLPSTELTGVTNQVMFPAFSKLQTNIQRLKEAYLKLLGLTSIIIAPISIGLVLLGPVFIRLFLKQDYHPMIPAFQILALRGLYRSIGGTRGLLFMAVGKPHINRYNSILRIIILCLLIYPLTRYYGITGTALTMLLLNVITNPLDFLLACRILSIGKWELYRPFLYPFLAALGMGVVVYVSQIFLFSADTLLSLFCLSSLGFFSYIGFIFLIELLFKNKVTAPLYEVANHSLHGVLSKMNRHE